MKIVLFGCNGQVGWELQRSLAPLGELIALSATSAEYCGDLGNLEGIADTIVRLRPDVVVNAAAYTAVDKAESEAQRAALVNAEAPRAMAQAVAACDALLVHYSTDYVFPGDGQAPWREDDVTGPLSVYGATKLQGEQHIVASGCRHLILRTSWVYSARGNNFAKIMLRLAQQRDELNVVDDQIGAPTGADLIADVTAQAIPQVMRNAGCCGTYHLAAAGSTSWADYARVVFEMSAGLVDGFAEPRVTPIPSSGYPTAAARPLNSRLDCSKLRQTFGLQLPDWRQGVTRMLTELHGK